jgi:hypothetical protein
LFVILALLGFAFNEIMNTFLAMSALATVQS